MMNGMNPQRERNADWEKGRGMERQQVGKTAGLAVESFVVVHVPHSCVYIPPEALDSYVAPLLPELAMMTDWFCDDLFACQRDMVAATVSRLYCDMERFRQDDREPMAQMGMGSVYTRCSDGSLLRQVGPPEREAILQQYYDVHHDRLTRMVADKLERFGRCLLIDGHSFHKTPLPHEPDRQVPRPDICIGTDDVHTPAWLVDGAVAYWERLGYTVAVNRPFAGTMVPMAYYGRDKRVMSIMVELNRALYCALCCDEHGTEQVMPGRHYDRLKAQVQHFVWHMEALCEEQALS